VARNFTNKEKPMLSRGTWMLKAVMMSLITVCGVSGLGLGCEERKTTTETEVRDKLLGGTEVKETTVIEQGDKTQVTETKTELKSDGTLEKRETTVKGDDIE
jgi:hypothetical protein